MTVRGRIGYLALCGALAAGVAAGCQAAPNSSSSDTAAEGPAASDIAAVFDGTSGSWVDLTHPFSESTVYWPTDTLGFEHEELAYGETDGGWFYAAYRFSGAEHGGTHLDAPIHFAAGRRTSDEIPLSNLVGPAVVVDVSERADRDYL
ncbi:MAG: cyclase family protein, partial [Gemmatimonadota bacterium]